MTFAVTVIATTRRAGGSFFYHFVEDRQYRFFPTMSSFLGGNGML